jgi:hypothetical protein
MDVLFAVLRVGRVAIFDILLHCKGCLCTVPVWLESGLRTTGFGEEAELLNGVKVAPTVWKVSSQGLHMSSNRASPSPPHKVELKDPTWHPGGESAHDRRCKRKENGTCKMAMAGIFSG